MALIDELRENYNALFEDKDDEKMKFDPKEYDNEGEMAKDQLLIMSDAAGELHDMIDDEENLPEWCQNKITKAMDYVDTVRDYMIAKKSKVGDMDDDDKDVKEQMKAPKGVSKMVNKAVKDYKKGVSEISVGMRNKYYDAAKKDIDRAKSSAVGKILRGKEADGTRHDHSIELRRIARREKGIKTAKNQAIKNIRRELYPKKKKNENIDPTLEQWKQKLSESVVIEKLKVSDGMGAWVKDFQKSDAPQFKGKDDKERRDMAIAAYLSAKDGGQDD
tara:strand:+ start:3274 stop:4098 length:825 start_codon:yes stop_codon:yes gene_type:complete